MTQIIVWILGGIAAYRLWEDVAWLSIVVIIFVITYGVHSDESMDYAKNNEYSNSTAKRLALTFLLVAGIFFYSLCV